MTCVYCDKNNKEVTFNKAEHVVPKSFGSFVNNYTLIGVVCDKCNKFFGDNFEIDLARGTLEGGLRYYYGHKDPKEFKSIGKRDRLRIQVEEGPFKGAFVRRMFCEENSSIAIVPLPQVGFYNEHESKYDYYLLDEISEKQELVSLGYDIDGKQRIIYFEEYLEETEKILLERNIPLKKKEAIDYNPEKGQEWDCNQEGTIDDVIFRAVAKIAFNYLIFWHGADFARHKDFDVIKKFILNGEKPKYPIFTLSDKPILGDEPVCGKRRLGHIITINYASDSKSIISRVSLYNYFTYTISIAREFSGRRIDVKRGNFFDVNFNKIFELGTEKPISD